MSTQIRDVVKRLPQLKKPSSQRPLKGHAPVQQAEQNDQKLTEQRRSSTATLDVRAVSDISTQQETGDGTAQHTEKESIYKLYGSESRSGSSPEEDKVDQLHKHKTYKDSKSGSKTGHKKQKQPLGPPFDFQFPGLSVVHGREVELDITDIKQQQQQQQQQQHPPFQTSSIYENYNNHHHQNQHRLSPLVSPDFDSSHHHLNECPFYTSEVSNLKLRIIELEYINATLENKILKYRDEIRLFKKDVKGYKSDGKHFAQILRERENEISILHRKITQLLNQDSLVLPSPPLSSGEPSPGVNSSNSSSSSSISSGGHKRHRSAPGPARKHSSASSGSGKYVRTLGHIDEEHENQWWL